MSVQVCEGVWRNRNGQRMVITQCEQVNGQQWTDGYEVYSDDGRYYPSQREDSQDLVAFVGLLPVSRQAETESTTAVAGGVSDDPGRIIYDLEERLKAANATIIGQTAEIERLQTEWQAEHAARLEGLLDNTREHLRELQEDHTAMDNRAEGARSAYLAVIKTLWEIRR